jgi:hypothetical protein
MNRLLFVAVGAAMLIACGGKPLAANKEAAAQALFGASQGTSAQRASSGANGAAVFSVTVNCASSGKMSFNYDVSGTDQSAMASYDLVFDGCSQDGKNWMTGHLNTAMTASSSSEFSMDLTLAGRVSFSGEVSDFVDANVTESITATALSATTGSVTIQLNGTITTSSGTYTYANEAITFAAGEFETASDP